MRRLFLPLVLLSLAACGDAPDSGSGSGGSGRSGPTPGGGPLEEVLLTDEMMREYVDLLAKWRERGRRGETNLAWLSEHGWDAKRWAYLQQGVLQAITLQGGGAMREASSRYEEQMREMEGRLAGTSGTQRDLLERQLEGMRKARSAVSEASRNAGAFDTATGQKNLEVLRRWLDRIHEAGR